MKEEKIEEKELSLEEVRKAETEVISLSSPIEEMQKEYMKQLKKLSEKKSQKTRKIYLFILIALFFSLLCFFIFLVIRESYAIMKKKAKKISNIKSLDSKGEKLNNNRTDIGTKIKKEKKRKKKKKKRKK